METGIILNFFKELNREGSDKTSIIKALYLYILERKPSKQEIIMLNKLIKDFGHSIVFEALVSIRYSDVNLETSHWGYLIAVCKNLLKESIAEDQDDILVRKTKDLLSQYK